MKYKVGDKVRVKSVQTKIRGFGGGMLQYAEQIATITNKYDRGGYNREGFYRLDIDDGFFDWSEEMFEPVAPTLKEVKEKKLSCVVHTKSELEAEMLFGYIPSKDHIKCLYNWWNLYAEETCYHIKDGQLGGIAPISFYKDRYSDYGKIYELPDLFTTGGTVSIYDLPLSEWHDPIRLIFENGSSIEVLPQKDDTVRGKDHFCNSFRSDKKIEYVLNEKDTKEYKKFLDNITAISGISYGSAINKLKMCLSAFSNDGISAKNGGKNSMKFTFYVTDWVDVDKTNGEKIPMKTTVAIGSSVYKDASTSCPATEYDERIGCLIAAAKISAKKSTETQMMYNIARSTWGTEFSQAIFFELADSAFNGNFERAYKKFHNDNIRLEKKCLTCNFCGKVFETIEEKTKHEEWHEQIKKNKKDKYEKYLIRKEAKRRLAEAEREGKIEQAMKELYKK